jgi:hypothetical protein
MTKIANTKVQLRVLRDAELEAVSGGATFNPNPAIGSSVQQQAALDLKRRLQAAYDANHPWKPGIDLG